ncbi:unnamed protein product [Ostreobium quekettii]|uniref:dolichyl-phosphate beta-glucosyltransferase n=1 Tax=Ostreobium quekettii TaxID=121088 RepID=A0A8S1J6A1_9CHLO|nr:unnamed protein product [Ostreobium quekettii]
MLSYVLFAALALLAIGLRRVRAACASLDATPPGFADLAFDGLNGDGHIKTPSIFDDPAKYLSVVVPSYYEQARLPNTLKETMHYLQRRRDRVGPHFTYEVLVVDDGSKDGTSAVATKAAAEHGGDAVRLLRMPRNCGKGYAVKLGMMRARGALCLMIDADGATLVSDVERLEAELRKITRPPQGGRSGKDLRKGVLDPKDWDYSLAIGGQVGAAFGSRAHLAQAARTKRSWYRNLLTAGFHVLVGLVAGNEVRDTQCGFKLFTRRAAGLLFANQRLRRWCFDVELLRLAGLMAVPVVEVHVKWTEMPGSKIKFWHIIHMAWELVLVKLGYTAIGGWRVSGESELYKKTD